MKFRLSTYALLAATLAAGATDASARTIEVAVRGLMCENCVAAVKKELVRFDAATTDVLVDVEAQTVAMALEAGHDVDDSAIEAAIERAGFGVVAIERTDATLAEIEARIAADAAK